MEMIEIRAEELFIEIRAEELFDELYQKENDKRLIEMLVSLFEDREMDFENEFKRLNNHINKTSDPLVKSDTSIAACKLLSILALVDRINEGLSIKIRPIDIMFEYSSTSPSVWGLPVKITHKPTGVFVVSDTPIWYSKNFAIKEFRKKLGWI